MRVYDAGGRLVAEPIASRRLPAGRTTYLWQPIQRVAGCYFVHVRIDGREQSQKVTWLGRR